MKASEYIAQHGGAWPGDGGAHVVTVDRKKWEPTPEMQAAIDVCRRCAEFVDEGMYGRCGLKKQRGCGACTVLTMAIHRNWPIDNPKCLHRTGVV